MTTLSVAVVRRYPPEASGSGIRISRPCYIGFELWSGAASFR